MEGWEIRRRRASFRGIELIYFGSSRTGGHRYDVHVIAKSERAPWAENMGAKERRFTVRGAVIGPDHDLDAKRLEEAFGKPEPGELVLPHRDPISVVVEDWRFEEPPDGVRIQTFEIDCLESGAPQFPAARANTPGIVGTRVDAALEAAREWVSSTFSISDQTAAATDRIVAQTAESAALVKQAFNGLKSEAGIVEEIAEFSRRIDGLANEISGSIVDAGVSAAAFQNAVDEMLDLPFKPLDVYRQLAEVTQYGRNLTDPGDTTVSRASFKRNQDSWAATVRQAATTARARALSRASFRSSTQAAEFRDEMAAELSTLIEEASDAFADEVVTSLRRLRTSVIQDLDARSVRLPSRVTYEMPSTLPSLVVAQRLYGDPTRAEEIVERNRAEIVHPGRIPFGTELEVLGDG